MESRVIVQQSGDSVAGLQLAVTAFKSALSDAALRANQAEAIAFAALDKAATPDLFKLISEHIDQRSAERAVQLQALVEQTILTLEALLQSDTLDPKAVNNIVKHLKLATHLPGVSQ